jgi:hypothetical protein
MLAQIPRYLFEQLVKDQQAQYAAAGAEQAARQLKQEEIA